MCFIVLSASGRGGFVGQRDLGLVVVGGWPEGLGAGLVGIVGAGVVAEVVVVLPRWWRVTGMKFKVAEA